MKCCIRFLVSIIAVLLLISAMHAVADEYDGTVTLGYQYFDTDGNSGVNQSTFNQYQGLEFSLERFSYRFDDGLNLSANVRDAFLGNRNIALGATKSGLWGAEFSHNGYRRMYDFNGDVETKRYRSNGRVWWRAAPWLKLDGGLGVTKKSGETPALFVGDAEDIINEVDYAHWFYHAGLTFQHLRNTARIEYRGSDYSDNLTTLNDRVTRRFRVSGLAAVPNYKNLMINAGYQYYRLALEQRLDTLTANTMWGGLRFNHREGYSARYSFIFDRARRTGDLTDADNITHAFYVGKRWRTRGGVTVGYRYRMNDDALDERTGNGYFVSAWFRPTARVDLKAGYGSDDLTVDEGRTLTGKMERGRGWLSARYRQEEYGWIRVHLRNRQTDYDDIGSSADFLRLGADFSVQAVEYGSLTGSYTYGTGEYTNSGGEFEYNEHILSGDITSKEYRGVRMGFGGTYLRNRRDLDVESFSVRFSGEYRFEKAWTVKAIYSSHNFDNFNDLSPVYSEYYTDNVVRISLSYDL